MRTSAALVALVLALAGCLAAVDESAPLSAADAAPRLVSASAPAHVEGDELVAEEYDWEWTPLCMLGQCDWPDAPECGEANCQRVPFRLDLAPDFWSTHEGGLEVSVLWPFSEDDDWRWIQARIVDASGTVVAEGNGGIGTVAFLEEAPAGDYFAEALAWDGKGAFEMHVEVEARERSDEARDLLPDLVVLPPTDLRIETPRGEDNRPAELAGAKGCSTYEATEGMAKRCLRFSNRVGNAGEGPLEVHLTIPEGLKALAGQGRHFQRVHATDGSFRDVDVGPASFHPTHSHFHYEGLNAFAVYEHDPATGERGELVNVGHKGGVCLVDSGLIALGMPNTSPPNYDVTCFYPAFLPFQTVRSAEAPRDWYMVLSTNWYDLYGWGLDDMYVDMTGAPDGVYELVSSTNTDAGVEEMDPTNNEASVVFRLTGDEVEVLAT